MCQSQEKPSPSPSNGKKAPGTALPPGSESRKSPSGKEDHGQANRLIREKSPYLLQHAYNPVDWYPWGPAAFAEAKKRDVPIFLSIGYSTCHWCHVMEKESFEDPEVAKLMNASFVSIKVDREERPDVDNVYMTVAQMMTGGGGWPLTIFMTPDKKPFHAATYISKESRYGRMGMMDLLPRVKQVWATQRQDIEKSASEVANALARQNPGGSAGRELGAGDLKLAYEQLRGRYDSDQGGFGNAPKFPTPHNLLFLLRYWKRTGEAKALEMAEKTLIAMRAGGMYDHVGFGSHRYSTDKDWFLPHFEKMLYDQAMLAMANAEAHQVTGKEIYARTVREILTYVLRDMTHPEGGFYSAEDADSEGEEGKFYVWSMQEIRGILPKADAEWTVKTFRLKNEGNFREEAGGGITGRNIFSLAKPLSAPGDLQRWEGIRRKLFAVREKRIHPHKDDKILTDWNGLMIAAMAKAGSALGHPEYVKAAERAAGFVLSKLRNKDGTLIHRYREGEATLAPHLDDYAFMVWGLLELYESTFEVKYLETAVELDRIQKKLFWDEKAGGFFFTAVDGEKLLTRQKEVYDGAIPSGNSVSMLNLLRLGRITGDAAMEQRASKLGRAFSASVGQGPSAHTLMMSALDFGVGPTFEVVISGDPSGQDTRKMLDVLRGEYQPRKVVVFRPMAEEEPVISKLAKYTLTQKALKGKATAYVCRNYVCNFPTNDPAKMLAYLKSPETPHPGGRRLRDD